MESQEVIDFCLKHYKLVGEDIYIAEGKYAGKKVKVKPYISSNSLRQKVGFYINGKDGKVTSIYLHRLYFLLYNGYLPEVVDHKFHNTLDNRKDNIRPATRKQNMYNMKKKENTKSKFKGVSIKIKNNKYKTISGYIKKDNKQIHLGCFETEIEAAKAYNKAATEYFGEFACLNQIEE